MAKALEYTADTLKLLLHCQPTSMRRSPLRIDRLQILRGGAPPSRRCKLPPGHDEWNGCGCALLAGVLGCRNLGGNAVRMDSHSILHLKRGALLGPPASAVVYAGGRNIRMPQPLLYLGDVRPMGQGIGGCRGAQRVDAKPPHIRRNPHLLAVAFHNVLIH